jgi:site-specific recombinase XerC
LEAIDADLVVRYLKERSLFKAKATLSGFVSVLRCAGEYLVRAGYWTSNPLRWLKGPKLDPFAQVPQRLDQQALTQLWQAVATLPNVLQRHQRLAQLALLYGLGLRRGELERLNVSDWNGAEGLVRVDGRKTGRERQLAAADFIARCVQGYLPHRQGAFGPAWLHVAAASAGLTAC